MKHHQLAHQAVKFPFDLELDEFCTPELVQKMRPAKDLLKKQLEAKEEAAKRKKRGGADADKPAEFPKKDTIKDQVDAALWNGMSSLCCA